MRVKGWEYEVVPFKGCVLYLVSVYIMPSFNFDVYHMCVKMLFRVVLDIFLGDHNEANEGNELLQAESAQEE